MGGKTEAEKKDKKYKKGDAKKGTTADLDSNTFANKDTTKWTNPKPAKRKVASGTPIVGLGKLGHTTKITKNRDRRAARRAAKR